MFVPPPPFLHTIVAELPLQRRIVLTRPLRCGTIGSDSLLIRRFRRGFAPASRPRLGPTRLNTAPGHGRLRTPPCLPPRRPPRLCQKSLVPANDFRQKNARSRLGARLNPKPRPAARAAMSPAEQSRLPSGRTPMAIVLAGDDISCFCFVTLPQYQIKIVHHCATFGQRSEPVHWVGVKWVCVAACWMCPGASPSGRTGVQGRCTHAPPADASAGAAGGRLGEQGCQNGSPKPGSMWHDYDSISFHGRPGGRPTRKAFLSIVH